MNDNTIVELVDKQSQPHNNIEISYEYIRGLTDGEGCFTFYPAKSNGIRYMIPAFVISMSARDERLLCMVADKLKINAKIHVYPPRYKKDGYKRQGMAIFIVRSTGYIKNIIVPLFYKKLHGHKGEQFKEWIEKIGNDDDVPERYRLIYKLCKCGFYDKNIEKFK